MSDTKTIYLAVTVPAKFDMTDDARAAVAHAFDQHSTINTPTIEPWHINTHETTDAICKEVDRIKSMEYCETVDGVVKSIIEAVRDGEVTDRDDLQTRLHEEIDGHHDIIYTYAAQNVIMQSSNDGAYFAEFGEEGAVEDGAINWSRLAYAALMADVNEALERSDELDINEDDLGWFECEDCDKRFQRSAWESEEHTDCCTECAGKRAEREAEEAKEMLGEADK